MQKQVVPLLLIVGCTLGLVWTMFSGPDRLDRVYTEPPADLARAQKANPWAKASANVARTEPAQAWGEEVTLLREGDGHFYADVVVNGTSARMLVDTGATTVALTGADAAAFGIYWEQSDIDVVAQGANGPVYGVRTKLPRVEVDGFEAKDVAAIIVPEGLGISLLGQAFLSSVDRVEITGDQMILSN